MATSSNPTQPNHSLFFSPLPNPNPKPRGRKSNNGNNKKSRNDSKDKPRRRGVGMAELERLCRLHHHSSSPPPPDDSRVNPLPGVPVFNYYIPGQPISNPILTHRVLGKPVSSSSYTELPSIPNPFLHHHHSTTHFTFKKRVIGEEVVGFAKGYNGHLTGYDLNNYNGDNNHQYLADNGDFSAHTASEIVAIHKSWNGSRRIMTEYGFFPRKSEDNIMKSGNNGNDDMKIDEDYLNLSSPSSSFSSLTTDTSNTTMDLSLKLSSYY